MRKILYILLFFIPVSVFGVELGRLDVVITAAENLFAPGCGSVINPVVVSIPAGADHCHFEYVTGKLITSPPNGTFCICAGTGGPTPEAYNLNSYELIADSEDPQQGCHDLPVTGGPGEHLSMWTPDDSPYNNSGTISYILVFTVGAYEEPPPEEPPGGIDYPPDEEPETSEPLEAEEYTGREDGDGLDSDDDVPTLNQILDSLFFIEKNMNEIGRATNKNLNNFRRTNYEQLNQIIALLGDIVEQGGGGGSGTVPEGSEYSGAINSHEVLAPPEISYQDNNYRLFDFSNAFLNPSVGDGSSLALTLPLSKLSSSFDDVPVDFSSGVLNTLRLAVRTVLLGVLAFWFCQSFISITRSFEY